MSKYRLRPNEPMRSAEEEQRLYGQVYPDGYLHDVWPDHVERIEASIGMLERWSSRFSSAADLSCGDAAILKSLAGRGRNLRDIWLGDLNGVRPESLQGFDESVKVRVMPPAPLPGALWQMQDDEALPVDLFVLSETLEHVPDPDDLLRNLGMFGRYLFVSTPLGEPVNSGNREHYWGWSDTDIHGMFLDTGWDPLEKQILVPVSTQHYIFQLWMAVCR